MGLVGVEAGVGVERGRGSSRGSGSGRGRTELGIWIIVLVRTPQVISGAAGGCVNCVR